MHRFFTVLLCSILLICTVSSASAQVVSCPEAHLILTVPDSWTIVPLSDTDDPDLRLFLGNEDLTLSVYVADAGGLMPDAFELFTGDETESGTAVLGGMEMTYVAGESNDGHYRIYTWLDRRNQVQMYFLITAHQKSSEKEIDKVMQSIRFE